MKRLKLFIARIPVLGRLVLGVYRAKKGIPSFLKPLLALIKWLFTSRETTNFTYNLEHSNQRYLASLIAEIFNEDYEKVWGYIREVEDDKNLRQHILNVTRTSDLAFMADAEVRYARRTGWYAIARVLKPKVIIETGVDKGLGACVLAAALKKNRAEGFEGRYFGTDINPKAGYLLSGEYASCGEVLYGDSITTLKSFREKIDLFINDSDHSADYEAQEYETIKGMLSESAVILGDNSHVTDKLLTFSVKEKRQFVFFQEKPENHWYPGAGIGISFLRRK